MTARLLNWFEARCAAPIYDAILPRAAAAGTRRLGFLAGTARTAPPFVVAANVAAVVAISLLPPLLIGRFSTFRGLRGDEQARCLECLQSHRIYSLRLLLSVAKFSALLSAIAERHAHDAGAGREP